MSKPHIKRKNGNWACGVKSSNGLIRWYFGFTPSVAYKNWFLQAGKVVHSYD